MNFEKKLANLEEIIEKVEDSEIPLEEAISLYKEGVKLAKECGEFLRHCEDEVLILQKANNGFLTEPFAKTLSEN